MVASGRPLHLEIDRGDGSGTETCPFSTVQSDTCASTYERSSARQTRIVDDLPVYTARARLVYAVTYAFNGAPMTITGAPDTLTSPWQEAAVPVAEIQTARRPAPPDTCGRRRHAGPAWRSRGACELWATTKGPTPAGCCGWGPSTGGSGGI